MIYVNYAMLFDLLGNNLLYGDLLKQKLIVSDAVHVHID